MWPVQLLSLAVRLPSWGRGGQTSRKSIRVEEKVWVVFGPQPEGPRQRMGGCPPQLEQSIRQEREASSSFPSQKPAARERWRGSLTRMLGMEEPALACRITPLGGLPWSAQGEALARRGPRDPWEWQGLPQGSQPGCFCGRH